MISRRDFYRYGSALLGSLTSVGLAIPCVAYVLDPLRRRSEDGADRRLTRLSALEVGVPRSFPIVAERRDAWVKYPAEPVGTVWLVRQPEGSPVPVLAFTAECPHLGCSIGLAEGGKSFLCPCHKGQFTLSGERSNLVSPRGMDALDVDLTEDEDPTVVVHFRRFRSQMKEKTPLG